MLAIHQHFGCPNIKFPKFPFRADVVQGGWLMLAFEK
jgi:hypothetical protein